MKEFRTHKDLEIWKSGIELVTQIYKITKSFPNEETYGLCSQMQRAAVSYPCNIAEGAARGTKTEYIRFLYISLGSLSELETQMIISEKLGYLNNADALLSKMETLRKKTLNFIKYQKGKR